MKTKSLLERKENILSLIAFASLKHWNEPTDFDNIQAEKGRIERVAELFYKKSDQEYNSFIISWLKENARKIVYTDEFTYDNVNIPDDVYELNIDLFCRKTLSK
jgi:hypothetical protein